MGSSNKPPTAHKKRKKKGRPSLLDLQKRSLRLQKQQEEKEKSDNPNPSPSPSPNPYLRFPPSSSGRRITRRNPHPDPPDAAEDDEDEDEAESSGGKRREKKLKLVHRLPPGHPASSNSASDSDAAGSARRKRKIDAVGSDGDRDKAATHRSSKAMGSLQGEPSDSGPTTPLPDKKLLVFILDRLQKKDSYGVFSEPVDPKELPDYHEVIQHPMDFGTIRKKLSSGAYANLEEFEKDVFLVSSNAMRYNAADTIYYRQARSIHELAKKNFENLRQESDDSESDLKTVVRRGRPPSKNKRPVGRPLEHSTSDFSPDSTLANAGDGTQWSNMTHDLSRKGLVVDKSGMMASHGLRNTDAFSWMGEQKSERNEEHSGPVLKGVSTKYGKKLTVIDENRRNTYKQPQQFTSVHEPPVLTIFDGEKKQLVPVGVHIEYSYLRSLARFAANLGPISWAIAAKKIERTSPPGMKFGPGWVGDADAPQQSQPTLLSASPPHPSSQPKILSCTTVSGSDKLPHGLEPPSNDSTAEKTHFRTTLLPSSTSAASNRPPDNMEGPLLSKGSNYENGSCGVGSGNANRSKVPFQPHQSPGMRTTINGFNNVFNMSSRFGKMVKPTRPPGPFGSDVQMTHARALAMLSRSSNSLIHQTPTSHLDMERVKTMADDSSAINSGNPLPASVLNSQGPWRGMLLQPKSDSVPPDLNVGFQSPGSPTSGMLVDSQQPDLALQL